MERPTKRIRRGASQDHLQDSTLTNLGRLAIHNPTAPFHGPILDLPVEILTEIFIYTAMRSYSFGTWRAVTQVCRRWRDTARGTPNLWAWLPFVFPIPLMKPAQWDTLTKTGHGSRCMPLHVRIRTNMWTSGYNARILGQLSRIKTLGIAFDELGSFDKIQKALMDPAPLLESLNIRWEPNIYSWIKHETLPPGLFGGCAPELRHVSLENCGGVWQADIFKNLTTLCIMNPEEKSRIGISKLVDVLGENTNLISLTLDSVLVTHTGLDSRSDGQRKVRLPCLSSFRYRGSNLEQDLQFMNHLLLASSPYVHFISELDEECPVMALSEVIKVLHNIRGSQAAPERIIHLEQSRNGLHYKGWVNVNIGEDVNGDRRPLQLGREKFDSAWGGAPCYTNVQLKQFNYAPDPNDPMETIVHGIQPYGWRPVFQKGFNITNLVNPNLESVKVEPVEFWDTIIPTSSNLWQLRLRGLAGASFLRYLVDVQRRGEEAGRITQLDGTALPLLPLELTLRSVNFSFFAENEAVHILAKSAKLRLVDCLNIPIGLLEMAQVTTGRSQDDWPDPILREDATEEDMVSVFRDDEPRYFEPCFVGEVNREPEYDDQRDLVYAQNQSSGDVVDDERMLE
ncbi:hypothetical protein BDN72DRAFT_960143 [Pluteus cervinus]|uniref:Uncharacterized protein n=1 Tax=Pluteus cervinus TaxID=181527 RepID=A0ACD3ASG0_9AGAR|nr:hypothetical protein BDN72DRAFT_960143 [Pluteus cervinus]